MSLMTTNTQSLYVGIIERRLSDKSLVHSVVIREDGGMPFIELDAIDEKHARQFRQDILVAIRNHTNINLDSKFTQS